MSADTSWQAPVESSVPDVPGAFRMRVTKNPLPRGGVVLF
jgi:hypothetical protein